MLPLNGYRLVGDIDSSENHCKEVGVKRVRRARFTSRTWSLEAGVGCELVKKSRDALVSLASSIPDEVGHSLP